MSGDFFGLGGHVIDGQFHAIEVAGEGGFSVVYRGQHLSLREPIAIKCLKIQVKHTNPTIVASFTQRFFDESRIMYRLSQGNLDIVRSVTSGVTMAPSTGITVPYMVLEWLDGVSLSKDLKDRRAQKLTGRPLTEVMTMFEPAALAIAYAHSQGVVHRDVKPGNLFLHARREGVRMKVLDFGMAKVLSPEAMGGLESAATLGGVMVVSPQYVTPEQLDARDGKIGPWTDVYSFALIMVEAITDRRAREAATFADLMVQITQHGPLPTPRTLGAKVTDAVEKVFTRAFARDPSERYADMGAFWSDLTKAMTKQESIAPAVTSEDLTTRTQLPVRDPDFAQTIGMPHTLPPEVQEYLAHNPPVGAGAKAQFGKTMPLAAVNPAAGAGRPFSGTVPLQAAPAMRGFTPPESQPVRPIHQPAPAPAPALAPTVALATAPAPAPAPMMISPAASSGPLPSHQAARRAVVPPSADLEVPTMQGKPRTGRVLVVFLMLFVVLAMVASGLLLYRTLVLQH